MASVWKRLQRVNKRAAKFQYTASYHRIDLETGPKWKPSKLSIVWTRRSRRVVTDPLDWEPSLKDPLKGCVIYPMPENRSVTVTLFRDSRTNELEDKDWTFVLEDVTASGKRRRLATAAINMRQYASVESSSRTLRVPLQPCTGKVGAACLHLTLHCVLVREGSATDEDMQSLASLMSVNNNSDIAVLEDLDEDDFSMSDNSTRQMLDFRQQMEEMTNSLTNSDIAATPNSVQSLNFDNSRTPTAPMTPSTPVPDDLTPQNPELTTPKSKPEHINNLTKISLPMKNDMPKFFSTPVKSTNVETKMNDGLKGVVFKTKHLSKHNLKPLEFKTNLNDIGLDRNENRNGSVDGTPVEDMTPVGDADKIFPSRVSKDKTPVQDLLEWCREVTSDYSQCKVTNLTTSWRNGIALCAVIHHFRPDLIDFSGLQPEECEQNVRIALEASARLGVSQVLTAPDVCGKPVPDRLAIMTHLFQLRAHFTGSELQVEQLGTDPGESSYLVGRHDTDGSMPRDLFSREVSARRSRHAYPAHSAPVSASSAPQSQDSQESRNSQERALSPEKSHSPTQFHDILTHSKQMLKALSPSRDKAKDKSNTRWFNDPLGASILNNEVTSLSRPEKLMTRKELTDPFGSDEEDDQSTPNTVPVKTELKTITNEEDRQTDKTPEVQPTPFCELIKSPVELPKPTPQLLSRHDELKERARQLLEAAKREAREKERENTQGAQETGDGGRRDNCKVQSNGGLKNGEISPKKMTEAGRQEALRERARKLIADARAGVVSPTSPRQGQGTRGCVEIISRQSVLDEIAAAGGVEQLEDILSRQEADHSPGSRSSSLSPDRSVVEAMREGGEWGEGAEESAGAPKSPLHSFTELVNRLTPDKDDRGEVIPESGSYIASEMEALEREQSAVDQKAAALERELRSVMESADNTEEEDKLMSQWFNLVNKKNALLRRQMQLNILEQEEDLSRRCELLARELRLSLAVDEWRKTPGQKRRERLLLQELLSAVNERDRLVQEMDEQEKAIADDDAIERNLSQVDIQRRNNCILQ